MIKHHILVKWNASAQDKKTIVLDVKKLFDELLVFEEVSNVELIENVIDRPNRFDMMICITMKRDFLPIYDASKQHHEWKEKYGKYVENKAIFDSEA